MKLLGGGSGTPPGDHVHGVSDIMAEPSITICLSHSMCPWSDTASYQDVLDNSWNKCQDQPQSGQPVMPSAQRMSLHTDADKLP